MKFVRIGTPFSAWVLFDHGEFVAELLVGEPLRSLLITARQLGTMQRDLGAAFAADADGTAVQLMVAGIEFSRAEAESLADTLGWVASQRAEMQGEQAA